MSAAGIGTKWYNLTIFGGVSIAPDFDSEEAIYGGLQEEGDEFERRMEPLSEKFEKIVLEAKEKFDAPIVVYDSKKYSGYIDGVIIEDVMEFGPSAPPAGISEERRQETLKYEEERFQRVKEGESFKKDHFAQYYKKGSHIPVEFEVHLPGDFRYYQFSFNVDNRIKRSTLNWIRDQINPENFKALPKE